jgi:hypothetical protein
MAETRPTGEQLRFVSANTGEHILDTYLEASEKGGRTLPDMLADIYDPVTGLFRSDYFEFRVNASTRILEFRVGDFPDTVTGWQAVDNGSYLYLRGDYASGTAYSQMDLVSYLGSVYLCITAHTSSTPAPSANFQLIIDADAIRGPAGVTPVTTANFDGGNAFTVPSNPNPALDLGSAT